jgi:hypothetical protein
MTQLQHNEHLAQLTQQLVADAEKYLTCDETGSNLSWPQPARFQDEAGLAFRHKDSLLLTLQQKVRLKLVFVLTCLLLK